MAERKAKQLAGSGIGQAAIPQRELERLGFNVSPNVAKEVKAMAAEMNMSMPQLFRYAFGILKIAMVEAKKKRKLVIADEEGTPIREVVLPS